MSDTMFPLGLILPGDDRPWSDKYNFRKLGIPSPLQEVEVGFPLAYPRERYDQNGYQACVGYSINQMMGYFNREMYDSLWIYHRAQSLDGIHPTKPYADDGTFLWAGFWGIRGGCKFPDRDYLRPSTGILKYYWGWNVDDIRTAMTLGRPPVIGIPWYDTFFAPEKRGDEWWIKIGKKAYSLGGHAIFTMARSDKRGGTLLAGTWKEFPPVWIGDDDLNRCLKEGGECCIAIDFPERSKDGR